MEHIDSLSEVLAICRAERAVTARFALRAPWALRSEGVPGAMIRVAQGPAYWLQVEGCEPVLVQSGDLVVLPHGSAHVMASDLALEPVAFAEMIERFAVGPRDANPLMFAHGGRGAPQAGSGTESPGTSIDSALLWICAYGRHSILSLLPPLLHVPASRSAAWPALAAGLRAMVGDTLQRRAGWRLAAARIGELLLMQALRDYFSDQVEPGQGWVRGLADPQVARAIAAIHGAPGRGWTVQSLARQAAMSRSRFAERFKNLVGQPPIGYLSQHRMAFAAQQLEADILALAEIAEQTGYESERVFARAFKRWSGLTPRSYQKRAQALRQQFVAMV